MGEFIKSNYEKYDCDEVKLYADNKVVAKKIYKTTKIIYLLNKIANHEEMPKKVKWDDIIWTWNEHVLDYLDEDVVDEYKGLFNEAEIVLTPYLNDLVEIIEDTPKEDKKIEKLDINNKVDLVNLWNASNCDIELANKINEIIDKVNGE